MFTARILTRLPTVHPSEVDIYHLMQSIQDLKDEVKTLKVQMGEVLLSVPHHDAPASSITTHTLPDNVNLSTNVQVSGEQVSEVRVPANKKPSFVNLFQTKDKDGNWFTAKKETKSTTIETQNY